MMQQVLWTTAIIVGFLCGGIMFCQILPRLIMKKNICADSDDKNPGAFNVFSSCGVGMGMVCLLLDMLKGLFPVVLGYYFLDVENLFFSLVIYAPVLGHAMGVFNRWHGGKCIAVSFGVLIGLLQTTWTGWILAGAYILFSTLFKIKSHNWRSIISFSIFGLLAVIILLMQSHYSVALGYLLIAATAIFKHAKNMRKEEAVLLEDTAEELSEMLNENGN